MVGTAGPPTPPPRRPEELTTADSPTTTDEYLEGLEPPARAELQRIRALVLTVVPGVTESISYRMPTMTYRGRALVHSTASKKHLNLYPSPWSIEEHADRLAGYDTTAHVVRFTPATALPTDLLEDLVRHHVRQIDDDRHRAGPAGSATGDLLRPAVGGRPHRLDDM